MTITVEFFGQLRTASGTAAETLDLPADAGLPAVVAALGQRHGAALAALLVATLPSELRPSILVFLNGVQTPHRPPPALRDGDTLTLMAPIAGG